MRERELSSHYHSGVDKQFCLWKQTVWVRNGHRRTPFRRRGGGVPRVRAQAADSQKWLPKKAQLHEVGPSLIAANWLPQRNNVTRCVHNDAPHEHTRTRRVRSVYEGEHVVDASVCVLTSPRIRIYAAPGRHTAIGSTSHGSKGFTDGVRPYARSM